LSDRDDELVRLSEVMTRGAGNTDGTGTEHASAEAAERDLYDAECALHVAHQTQVDPWISAAADHLHEAVLDLLDAEQHAT
jgi:hypothetical protein